MKDRKLEIDENKITGFLDKETEIKGELNFKGSFRIDGNFKGNIQAKEKVIINSGGRVIGTITTPILVVEEGAYLETSCQTTDKMPRSTPEKGKEHIP